MGLRPGQAIVSLQGVEFSGESLGVRIHCLSFSFSDFGLRYWEMNLPKRLGSWVLTNPPAPRLCQRSFAQQAASLQTTSGIF